MKAPLIVILALFGCLILSGCNTTSGGGKPEPVVQLEVGMPVADLIEQLGQPALVKPMETRNDGLEVWVYEFESNDTKMVPTTTYQRPYVNPVTGEMLYEEEPVYEAVDIVKTATLEVLMSKELVVAWKAKQDQKQEFSEN